MKFAQKALCSLVFFLSCSSYAATIGGLINSADKFLECDQMDDKVKFACKAAQDYVNSKLTQANIQIDGEGILYKNIVNQSITINDSCSRKTTINRQELALRLKSTASLKLSGNFLSEPAIMALSLPVSTYARFDAKDEFGHKVFTGFSNKCVRYGSDSYYGDAGVSSTAQLLAFLSLEPKFALSAEGDYIFALKPIFDIQASVGDIKISNFDIHGANAFFNIYSAATSLSTDLITASDTILGGGSVKSAFLDLTASQIIGNTQSVFLTDYALSNPLLINKVVDLVFREYIRKGASVTNSGLSEVAAGVKAKIANSLQLDANGMLYIVLGPDFKQKPVTANHINLVNPICPANMHNARVSGGLTSDNAAMMAAAEKARNICGICGFYGNSADRGYSVTFYCK